MGFDVYAPDPVPRVVGCVNAALDQNACVGAEEIDAPVLIFDRSDEMPDISFICDIDAIFQIGGDNGARALGFETPAKRSPDPIRASRDHRYFAGQIHTVQSITGRLEQSGSDQRELRSRMTGSTAFAMKLSISLAFNGEESR